MRINSRIPNKASFKNPKRLSKLKPFGWIVERRFAWLNAFRVVKTCWKFKEKKLLRFLHEVISKTVIRVVRLKISCT
ncbi:hypothetical protein DQM28_13130 [Leptospira mayottensis]|uniref:Transposase DDE domain-containing protein n=1 Tax=Leptospira mayottensis TaxID=1137606 RepID=A0ABN5NT52_9LEPT|nr:hypothetical protein DQM28_13130 [Leptospira mayottensis]